MDKYGRYTYNDIKNLSREEKEKLLKLEGDRANKKMKVLEKKGKNPFILQKTQTMLEGYGRKNFSTSAKRLSNNALNKQLIYALNYNTSQSGSYRNLIKLSKNRADFFKENFGVDFKKVNEKDFYTFLSSIEFKHMRSYMDSTQLIEDFINLANTGVEIEEIKTAFRQYELGNINKSDIQNYAKQLAQEKKLFRGNV